MKTDLEVLSSEAAVIRSRCKHRPKYSREFQLKVVGAIEQGHCELEVKQATGITTDTLRRWLHHVSKKPSSKKHVRQSGNPSNLTFAPVVEGMTKSPLQDLAKPTLQLDYQDGDGRRLNLTIPWDNQVAGPLVQFIGESLLKGVAPCCK